MKIVIEIEQEVYEACLPYKDTPIISNLANYNSEIIHAIANGIPLPKGHGDLISRFRDYQIEWLTSHNDIDLHETEMWVVQFLKDTAECFLKTELPSAEKTAEWIKQKSGDELFPEEIVCSKCYHSNSHLDFDEHNNPIGKVFLESKYCPNCGAKMEGGKPG